jgi:hypothetical protein
LIFKSWNTADYEFAKLGAADGEPIWTLPARAWSVADVAAGAGRLVLLGRWAELGVDFDPGDGQDSSLTTSTGPFITAMDEDGKYVFTRDDLRSFVHVLAIDAKGKIHVARIDSAHIGPDPSVPPEDQNDLNLFIETFAVVSD